MDQHQSTAALAAFAAGLDAKALPAEVRRKLGSPGFVKRAKARPGFRYFHTHHRRSTSEPTRVLRNKVNRSRQRIHRRRNA
jgi:hypothetical protein